MDGKQATTRMYCRKCNYELAGLSEPRCPECGQPFDPADRRTFLRHPHQWWLRRWGKRFGIVLPCLLALLGTGIGWLYWSWHSEADAIAALENKGALVVLKPMESMWRAQQYAGRFSYLLDRADRIDLRGWAIKDSDLAQAARLRHVTSLALSSADITNAGLACLKQMPDVRSLRVDNCGIDDGIAEYLQYLPNLKSLDLNAVAITDKTLEPVTHMKQLTALALDNTDVTDQGLSCLANLTQLRDLNLDNTRVHGAGLVHLKNMSQLQSLRLQGLGLQDADLANLVACRNLRQLALARTCITNAGLEHIRSLQHLQSLNIKDTEVSRDAVQQLIKALPGLDMVVDEQGMWQRSRQDAAGH